MLQQPPVFASPCNSAKLSCSSATSSAISSAISFATSSAISSATWFTISSVHLVHSFDALEFSQFWFACCMFTPLPPYSASAKNFEPNKFFVSMKWEPTKKDKYLIIFLFFYSYLLVGINNLIFFFQQWGWMSTWTCWTVGILCTIGALLFSSCWLSPKISPALGWRLTSASC